MKTVYSFDFETKNYLGPLELDESDQSPLQPGVYLLPAGTTDVAPPELGPGQCARFIDGAWAVEAMPRTGNWYHRLWARAVIPYLNYFQPGHVPKPT